MSSSSSAPLHVVLGAGQIGTLIAERLLARGLRVRQVRRTASAAPATAHLERRHGDLADPAFAREACAGASVIYHCVNAPYDRWARLLLPLSRGVLAGAAAAPGATLVVLDNLYMYDPAKGPMHEGSPIAPRSKKGELRARQHEELLAAHASGAVRLTIGRASDFFGPGVTNAAVFGERFWTRVLAGKPAESLGDPDALHSYAYGPDVADALVTLGARPEALGRVWHLPHAPAVTTRALVERLAGAVGAPTTVSRLPDLLLRAFGLFSPVMREVPEITYQWKLPFVVDDSAFRATFGGGHTPLDEAVAASVAWARAHHAMSIARTRPARAA